MQNIWRAIHFVPEYRGRVVRVLAATTVLAIIGVATPQIYKRIVDVLAKLLSGHASAAAATHEVALLVCAFLALRAGVVVFSALCDALADDLWLDAVSTFRQRVFDNMTRSSIDYFEKTRVGEIMDRFSGITQITMWLMSLVETTLASALQMLFTLGFLLIVTPPIGLILLAVVICNLWLSSRTVVWTKPYRRGWQALAGRMTGLLAEMVSNISTVRSFGGEPAVKERYDRTQAEWKVQRDGLHKLEWRTGLWLNLSNSVAIVAAVSLAAYGTLQGRYTPGDVLLVLTLTQNLTNAIQPVARQFNQMAEIDSTAERLNELLDVASDVDDAPDAVELSGIESVTFQNVDFSYPGKRELALHDVSFHVDKNESLALVGPSGSGKTTLVKLLLRFYDPTAGRILINGVDLRRYTQRSVRGAVGVVLQDVALFNDDIETNIAFARPGSSGEQVREAARVAHADDFIQRLPEGYATRVGERGIKLSGGEKQRVAIARAVLKNPDLIVLDEATSALDSESEHLVQAGFARLLGGRCSIVIAHRLSTVMEADQIVVLRQGQVVERGRHQTLSQRAGGLYAKLFALQTERPSTRSVTAELAS
ncbi:MAG TPA: ABC transporter ATP-binding protein [Polyangiaceae bacterium]|nr:ABC transporter ATP-binding protein [Polyangiaceae bacterium]